MAFWALEVTPKQSVQLSIGRRLVLKQAALLVEKESKALEPTVLTVSVEPDHTEVFTVRGEEA